MKNKSLKHWLVLVCCCGLAASSIGSVINTVGVFFSPVSSSLNVGRGTFALHSTIVTLTIAFVSLITPKLMEKLPFKLLIIIGTLCCSLSSLGMAMANNIMLFYILAIIKGFGGAIYSTLLITTILNHWFDEKRGLAISITLSFSGVAGAILSPILTNIINTSRWRTSYIVLAIITALLSVPAVIYPFHITPNEDGLLPYGANSIQVHNKKIQTKSDIKIIDCVFILFLIVTLLYCGTSSLASHLPGYAESINISNTVGATMLSATMIGNIGSKLIIGILADKLGSVKSIYIMTITTILSLVLIMLIHSEIVLIISSVLFGCIYSIAAVGLSLLTREFFGDQNYAKVYSIVSFAINLGVAFAATSIGYIYDFFKSYNYAFIILIGCLLFNIVVVSVISKKKIANV